MVMSHKDLCGSKGRTLCFKSLCDREVCLVVHYTHDVMEHDIGWGLHCSLLRFYCIVFLVASLLYCYFRITMTLILKKGVN